MLGYAHYLVTLYGTCILVRQTYVGSINDNIKRLFRERLAESEVPAQNSVQSAPQKHHHGKRQQCAQPSCRGRKALHHVISRSVSAIYDVAPSRARKEIPPQKLLYLPAQSPLNFPSWARRGKKGKNTQTSRSSRAILG
ncbi:hypothetical protein QBC45DRAFT_397723 [Copromyces sp. CBS 386.78]|nr:hypothetical protein QBC45DRAFT_397723 [Copromyces sp. CBS 386.78]